MTLFQISYHWVWGFFKPTSKKMWTYQCKWISNFTETNASSLVLYGCENSLFSYINRPVFQWVAQVFHLSHPNWVSLYISTSFSVSFLFHWQRKFLMKINWLSAVCCEITRVISKLNERRLMNEWNTNEIIIMFVTKTALIIES